MPNARPPQGRQPTVRPPHHRADPHHRAEPPPPKPRSKAKTARPRSTAPKKGTPVTPTAASTLSDPPSTVAPKAAPNVAPNVALNAIASVARPDAPPAAALPSPATVAAAASTSTALPAKRARVGASAVREPDAKRLKTSFGPRAHPHAHAHAPTPASPTTSSRSRPRSRKRSGVTTSATATDGGDPMSASHVLAAGTSSAATPRARSLAKRGARLAAPPPPHAALLTLDGLYVVPIVKQTCLARRLFGREIQALMHAFGEVRHCARDVLELVEDAARDVVVAVLHRTAAAGDVTVASVTANLPNDPRASYRMRQTLKLCADGIDPAPSALGPNHLMDAVPIFQHSWEYFAELGNLSSSSLPVATFPQSDVQQLCSWRALHAFRIVMGESAFTDFLKCRAVVFVRADSRARQQPPKSRAKPPVALFREWLGPALKYLNVNDAAIMALGHIAWEAVGLITQTALLNRYFDDLARGIGDPRAKEWAYPRHLIAALAHGLGCAILVPLTEFQAIGLRQEIETFFSYSPTITKGWRAHSNASSPFLLPQHINEAVRRLQRSPHSPFGFPQVGFVLRD